MKNIKLKLTITSVLLGSLFLLPKTNTNTAVQTTSLQAFADEISTEKLDLSCKAAYCMDSDSKTAVYTKNAEQHLPIASMCKIMTLILTFDAIDRGELTMETLVPVSEHAMSMGGSQVYLAAGLQYSVDKLLESIVVCSANDSCVAMAEYLAGSDTVFVERMNERAKSLGCENTLFANCTGLPKDPQYSCAKDVAYMLRELIKHQDFFRYANIRTDNFKHPDGRETLITNTNKLTKQYEGCDGGKTGFTSQAGFCLAATAKRNDMRVISVCIGADNTNERAKVITTMFDYCFANYTTKEIISAEKSIEEKLRVPTAKEEYIDVSPQTAVNYFTKKQGEKEDVDEAFTYTTEFYNVKPPFEKGTIVGKMTVFKESIEYVTVPLISNMAATEATYFDYFLRLTKIW